MIKEISQFKSKYRIKKSRNLSSLKSMKYIKKANIIQTNNVFIKWLEKINNKIIKNYNNIIINNQYIENSLSNNILNKIKFEERKNSKEISTKDFNDINITNSFKCLKIKIQVIIKMIIYFYQ